MTRRDMRQAIIRLPLDLHEGISTIAHHRGEAAATVVREILREALIDRGVIEAGTPARPKLAAPSVR